MSRSKRKREPASNERSKARTYLVCGFLLFAAAIVFFLPNILVNTPLKQTAINWVTADVNGKVSIENISAGWLTPIELSKMTLVDDSGNEIATVQKISSNQTLLGLISGTYGNLTIEKPSIDLVLRRDGSNLEDAFSKYTQTTTDSSESSLPQVNVRIIDGVVGLRSNLLPNSTAIESINADIQVASGESAMTAVIQMGGQSQSTGKLDSTIVLDPGKNQILGQVVSLTADASNFSLASFAPLLTRVIGPANMAGVVNGGIEINVANNETEAAFTGFETSSLGFMAPEFLGNDQFSAQTLTMTGRIRTDFQNAFADGFKAESEFARLTANGDFNIEQLNHLATGGQLPSTSFQIDGVVDLAQIATMLPESIHIRDGVKMNSGMLQLTATARNENGAPRLVFNADAANMNFVVDGRQISWNKPLRAVAVAGVENNQLALEDIRLESDFLTASGNASWTSGKLKLQGDLRKVMDQVGQVIDTGDLVVAGIADGNVSWDSSAAVELIQSGQPAPIQLTGYVKITDPQFSFPGIKPWREREIDLNFTSTAEVTGPQLSALQSTVIDARIGSETLNAVLAESIRDFQNTPRFQFNCQANGSIAKWIAQARNFATFPQFFCDGNLQSKFLLTLNTQAVRLNQIQFDSRDFQFDGFSLNIREPKINGRGNLKYDLATGKVVFTKARVASSSFAANTDSIELDLSEKILADGIVNFRADANRASNWLGFSLPDDSVRWNGDATGTMTFKSDNNMFGGELAAKVKQMVFVQPVASSPPNTTNRLVGNQTQFTEFWREPELNLRSSITLSDDFNNVELNGLTIQSKTTNVRLDGTIQDLANSMRAELKGQWKVRWEAVNATVREMAGDVIQFQGASWQPLHIRGPLYTSQEYQWLPNQLAAAATLGWDQAKLYNIPLGGNQIDVRIDESLANLASTANNNIVDRVFGMEPVVDLRNAEPVVYLREGKLLDQWAISNEDSRTWLKYVAPLIADATSAQGTVSTLLEGAAIPVFDPLKSSARGVIDMHQLTVGAGPLVQQLLPLVDQVRAIVKPDKGGLREQSNWLQLKPQQLPFTVRDGRVHHSDFELAYKDVVIRTSGSVGFDQSLSMVAQIPIDEKWVAGNKTFARLAGKSISIPISGSLSKPTMDRRAVTQFASQVLKDTAIGAAKEKVNEEVGKLQNKFNNEVQGELNEFQEKLNGKIKTEFEDKIQNELKNGFNKFFGGGKK